MHKVIVEKGYLSFSAAHFISFAGKCERLHGHNYAVSVELEGELTAESWVFDFVALKHVVRRLCDELDHRFLLPEASDDFEMEHSGGEWEVRFQDQRYVFPEADVLTLPVDNITAERLAEYLCAQLLEALRREQDVSNLTSVTVGVEEAPGQTAFYRRTLL
jgi:6-pyruvoyltetrahydropterin/6-carboxytetrahydropterin synthase